MTETPNCPECGSSPVILLDRGSQAFCGNDACVVLMWDSQKSPEWNRANTRTLDARLLEEK